MLDGLPESKYCSKCKETLPREKFHRQSRSKSGLQDWCISCRFNHKRTEKRAYDKARYHEKKEDWQGWYYSRHYGIDLHEYKRRLEEQSNVCAICKGTCPTGRRLAVDHCHESGKVRGLLCTKCNSLLGQANSSLTILKEAQLYLERFNEQTI